VFSLLSIYGLVGCIMSAMASPGHPSESKQVLEAQLQVTLGVIPAYTWYAVASCNHEPKLSALRLVDRHIEADRCER